MGPSGCLLCRREGASPVSAATSGAAQAAAAPLISSAPAAAVTAPPVSQPLASAAPAAAVTAPPVSQPLASASPSSSSATAAKPAPFAPVPVLPTQVATLATRGLPEPPAAPATVTDNPPSLRFSIHVHPLALVLVPVALVAALLLVIFLPGTTPVAAVDPNAALAAADEPGAAAAKATAAGDEKAPGNDDEATDTTDDDSAEPLLPPELAAKKTAELERLHAEVQRKAEREQLLTAARGRLKVKVYYRQDCNSCSEARRHLAARGVRAEELDIDQEPKARARHRSLNPRGRLPTIEVEGKVLKGFEAQKLDRAIDRAATARLKKGR